MLGLAMASISLRKMYTFFTRSYSIKSENLSFWTRVIYSMSASAISFSLKSVCSMYFILFGHGQLLRGYKVEGGREMAHGHNQRMYRPAIFQVAYQIYVEIL